MEKRRFGRTGHMSTVAIFGAAAFYNISQEVADRAMEQVMAAGVNHIDVAHSYGQAEERLGPWMKRERGRFFLASKTEERGKSGALAELHESLKRLQVEDLDLHQIHAVTRMDELDQATRRGGALDALLEAREQGLIRNIGITGHGVDAPAIFLEALKRFDFDSILFPLNFIQYANPVFRENAEALLAECRPHEVGVRVIKAIAKGPWGDKPKIFDPWYEPFSDADHIQMCVNFALSQDITGICTVADVVLLPLVLQACEQFTPLSPDQQEDLIATAGQYEPLFAS